MDSEAMDILIQTHVYMRYHERNPSRTETGVITWKM